MNTEIMKAIDFQDWLEDVLNEQDITDECASLPFGIGVEKVTGFATYGMLTSDAGLVVKTTDSTGNVKNKFAITIQKLE